MPDDVNDGTNELIERPDGGPREWFLPRVEESYYRLVPRELAETQPPPPPVTRGMVAFESTIEPNAGESVLARVNATVWRDRLAEFQRRKAASTAPAGPPPPSAGLAAPAAPTLPGARNWRSLGPEIVTDGQTVGSEPVGGRTVGLAIAPGGQTAYAATAAGGVFRTDNGGDTWRSTMDGFDLDPTHFASASLVCGAIAIDPNNIDRVYVGTGEGDTHQMFQRRIVNALPAYRGIGPIRSDDGGAKWEVEPSFPDLAGHAFFALAVDPWNRENVFAATTIGLYQRTPQADGTFAWQRRRSEMCSTVVVAEAGGIRRFFTAEWGGDVLYSEDGVDWHVAGSGLPTFNIGRIALGVQSDDPNRLYALVTDASGRLEGVYRLDQVGGSWRRIDHVPDVVPGGQGDYDLAIAVDPLDFDRIFLGGDYANISPFPASIWRCELKSWGMTYRVDTKRLLGRHAHSDVHGLVHTPGDPDQLWAATDGGVFLHRDPRGTGEFEPRNQGLSCLLCNFIDQHPHDRNLLFTGLQDNGTARTDSPPQWKHVSYGDGGYCLINWRDPLKVLVFQNGAVLRTTTGGTHDNAWQETGNFDWVTMTQPIVGAPYTDDPSRQAEADFVAAAAGSLVEISEDFGASWSMVFTVPSGRIFALAVASPKLIYAGTAQGQVYRAERSGHAWTVRRLDNAPGGPLGLVGLITDIAVDWNDPSHHSIYVTFGGMGDPRRVWRYDGSRWEDRCGAPGRDLLDVEHNALVVDPVAPENVYVGADIGVWHSPNRGLEWHLLQNGLPDAPVFDLKIHPTLRLLRAATHGRGVYEIDL